MLTPANYAADRWAPATGRTAELASAITGRPVARTAGRARECFAASPDDALTRRRE